MQGPNLLVLGDITAADFSRLDAPLDTHGRVTKSFCRKVGSRHAAEYYDVDNLPVHDALLLVEVLEGLCNLHDDVS